MLCAFPDPYPGELVYSICARFQERVQYPSLRSTVEDLFQTKNAIAIFDLPSRLDRLVKGLHLSSCYTTDYFIDNHTLLPFYSPFLPLERLKLIRSEMCGDNGSKIHARLGIVAGSIEMPLYLRYCPLCVQEDKEKFGECYWHREHQLSGVEVCPVHGMFLEKSHVSTHNRRHIYEFTSAEQATQQVSPHPVDPFNPCHKILLQIARDVKWLLNDCRIVPGEDVLYQNYRCAVMSNPEWVTKAGRVRVQELLKAVKNFYPDEVLKRLQCPINEQIRDNWLVQLVRLTKRFHHPLRHLLLIQFLRYTASQFFEIKRVAMPFGSSPWYCLNPTCKHYKAPVIEQCQITYNQENYQPVGIFACSCGFIYCRNGPDKSPEDAFRYCRVKYYGTVWQESLKAFWSDASLTLKQIGERLGVDYKTVLRQADKLQLSFPRPNTRATATELCPSLKSSPISCSCMSDTLESYHKQWLEVMAANPEMGRMQLRNQASTIYAQLYKYDREWLKKHLPPRRTNNATLNVDWESRDAQTVETVKVAVERILEEGERPTWISRTAISNSLGHPASSWVKKYLKKLPQTTRVLEELAESTEEFAVRRIQWAAQMFRQENVRPQRWQLVRRAGLRKQVRELPLVTEVIVNVLESFKTIDTVSQTDP